MKTFAFWRSRKVISIPFFAILLNMISDLVELRLEFSGQDSPDLRAKAGYWKAWTVERSKYLWSYPLSVKRLKSIRTVPEWVSHYCKCPYTWFIRNIEKTSSMTLLDPGWPFDDPMYQSITELDIFAWEFLYSFWCQLTFSQ